MFYQRNGKAPQLITIEIILHSWGCTKLQNWVGLEPMD